MQNNLIIGRVATKETKIELKGEEKKYVRFPVATDRPYKNKDGKYDSDFIPITAYGSTAEFIAKYFEKGSPIGVKFEIRNNNWEKDGEVKYGYDFVASEVFFLPSSSKKSETPASNTADQEPEIPEAAEEIVEEEYFPFA